MTSSEAFLERLLDFIEQESIDRVCFYHLVYSGRGSNVVDVTHEDTRRALDKIIERTAFWARNGTPREVLTVDQPADGAYLYMRLLHLEGCCASCRIRETCAGGFRVRALQVHKNMWAPDPACYLSDEEIQQTQSQSQKPCSDGCGDACGSRTTDGFCRN